MANDVRSKHNRRYGYRLSDCRYIVGYDILSIRFVSTAAMHFAVQCTIYSMRPLQWVVQ